MLERVKVKKHTHNIIVQFNKQNALMNKKNDKENHVHLVASSSK